MPEQSILDGNEAVTARLETLVSRLSDKDLAADLGGGWTTAVALGHLAFWDRRIAYVLTRWRNGGEPHQELDDDVVNSALEEVLKAVEPRAAARLSVQAAKAANAAIAATPDAIASQLIAEGHTYLLSRHNHRTEHIEQIERALG
jgi:hypothetical protein